MVFLHSIYAKYIIYLLNRCALLSYDAVTQLDFHNLTSIKKKEKWKYKQLIETETISPVVIVKSINKKLIIIKIIIMLLIN